IWSQPSTFQPDSLALARQASTFWPSAAAVSDGAGEAWSSEGKKNAPNRRVLRSVQGMARVLGTSALSSSENFVWLIRFSRLRWHHSPNRAYRSLVRHGPHSSEPSSPMRH